MAEYIEREAAQIECRKYSFAESYDAFAVDCILKAIPAVDVAPVRHGRWIWNEEGEIDWEQFYRCSNCGDKEYWESNFCPNCGAKMDLGE